MKIALLEDIKSTKKYTKELQVCITKGQEHISRKKTEYGYLGVYYH